VLIGIKNPLATVTSHIDLDVWSTDASGTILDKSVIYNVFTAEAHPSINTATNSMTHSVNTVGSTGDHTYTQV